MTRSDSTRRRILMASSIAPKPYKPPVWWSILFIGVASLGAWAFVFALAWIVLSPLGAL